MHTPSIPGVAFPHVISGERPDDLPISSFERSRWRYSLSLIPGSHQDLNGFAKYVSLHRKGETEAYRARWSESLYGERGVGQDRNTCAIKQLGYEPDEALDGGSSMQFNHDVEALPGDGPAG
jgi:hypothetical protein